MRYVLQQIETERIRFREIDLKDFESWLEFFKDPESFKHWKEELQSPEIECNKWYAKQFNRYETNRGGMNALIERSTGKLIGHCGLLVQTVDDQQELEIGYSLLSTFRGKGFAFEAASVCKSFAFQNNFTDSLISIISLTNTPSARVALKNGMTIDKQTMYNGNAVNIFRIRKSED